MVEKGWSHRDLCDMSEPEFVFWLDQQKQIEEWKLEALEEE